MLAALALATLASNALAKQERFALVIGNTKYHKERLQLRNPGNDAELVAKCFEKLGFKVDRGFDLTHEAMDDAVDGFCAKLSTDSVAIVYYAGHGLQIAGDHYLVPVDARIEKPGKVRFQTYSEEQLVEMLEDTRTSVRLVILDCCRNNPWERGWRGLHGSSRSMRAYSATLQQSSVFRSKGTAIFYSTADGQEAPDGVGMLNSPFTSALAEVLANRPPRGLTLIEAITTTSRKVAGQVDQQPWLHYPPAMPKCWLWEPRAAAAETQFTSASTAAADSGQERLKKALLQQANRPSTDPPKTQAAPAEATLAPRAEPKPSELAKILLDRASSSLESGEYGRAIRDYEVAIREPTLTDKSRNTALLGRGEAYKRRGEPGDIERALADYQAADAESMPLEVRAASIELKYRSEVRGRARRGQMVAITSTQRFKGQRWYFVTAIDGKRIKACWAPESAFEETATPLAPPAAEPVAASPQTTPIAGARPAPQSPAVASTSAPASSRQASQARSSLNSNSSFNASNIPSSSPSARNPSPRNRSNSSTPNWNNSLGGGQRNTPGQNRSSNQSGLQNAAQNLGQSLGGGVRRNDMTTAPVRGGGRQGTLRGNQFSGNGNRGGRGRRGRSGH